MKPPENIALYLGILSPVLAFSFIGAAILTHPWFSFQHNALSDLGNPNAEMSWIFNTGLIIAGLTGLVFTIGIMGYTEGLQKAGIIIFAVAMVFLTMIGLFPEGTAMHWPSAVSFYLLSAVAIICFAVAWVLNPASRRYGIAAFLLVVAVFAIALIPEWDGIAIPETAGAIAIFLWLYMLIWQIYPSITG